MRRLFLLWLFLFQLRLLLIPFGMGIETVNKVAITFDDGPKPGHATAILDILYEYGVKANFFVVGQSIEKYPDLVYQIHNQGHELANHSYSHRPLTSLSRTQLEHEFYETNRLIKDITNIKVSFFRPPGGKYDWRVLRMAKKYGLKTIFWDINPGDYVISSSHFYIKDEDINRKIPVNDDRLFQRIKDKVQPGSIILLHNGGEETIAELPKIIRLLREKGLEPVTLTELFNTSTIMKVSRL